MRFKIFIFSIVLDLSTIFWSPILEIKGNKIEVGLPLKFIWYYDYHGLPNNRFEIFKISNLVKIDFRILSFLLNVVVLYFFILFITKNIKTFRIGNR